MAHIMFNKILYHLFLSVAFLRLTAGVDTHILLPNQTIAVGQSLISRSQVFEMGFFSPGKSLNKFLGIWYKNTPDVVVWVANRNNPITDSQGVTFAISGKGSLVISRDGSIIWSANSSGMASNPVLQLLDTGNLVLVNNTMKGGMPESYYIWQSFDYPTDTWLPGTQFVDDSDAGVEKYLTSWRNWDDPAPGYFVYRVENLGLPELVAYRGNMKTFRTGKWNGVYFSGILPFPNLDFKPDIVSNEGRLISMIEPYDSSVLVRIRLDPSGLILRYKMNARKDRWNLVYTLPQDTCDEYGLCGPNAICRINRPIRCECLKGFVPKLQKDWDHQDWSGGCSRITPLNCQSRSDGFLEVRGVKYPDLLKFWLNNSMSLDECQAECLKNCSCTAYANPYMTTGSHGCVMWFGDLIDTRGHYLGEDIKQNIYIRYTSFRNS